MMFDCGKTLDYAHEVSRLCESLSTCTVCPLYRMDGGCNMLADHFDPDAIDIMQEWSDTHPMLEEHETSSPTNDTDRVIVMELQEQVNYLQNKNKEYIETIQVLKKDISKKKQIISELREE